MLYYAGVGSRETPKEFLYQMELVAKQLCNKGFILRSGGAIGADTAFATGAGDRAVIYRPSTDKRQNPPKNHKKVNDLLEEKCRDIVSKTHKKWKKLDEYSQALHARNVCQVIGHDYEKSFADKSLFVLCWTPIKDGVPKGGTATAIKVAEKYCIPVINMYNNPEWKQQLNQVLIMSGLIKTEI